LETHTHWSEQLAEKVTTEKKPPYVISCGMTTSGPAHFGTICEFLYPFAIREALEKKGQKTKFYLVADILDAFDNISIPMQKYTKQLQPHLGKPLGNVPDPTGKSKSFGDHYLDEVRELMKKLGVRCTMLRANDMYAKGKFDAWAKFYLKNEAQAKKIIERTSGRELPQDFSVIMPICEKCGKVATTVVTRHDNDTYVYTCNRDVKYIKGCGFQGEAKIADHRYKIVWRLHWPAWKQILKTSIEGAGVDHYTKGGSEDTCEAITLELMKKPHHVSYRYGFVLLKGQKYSKSKGLGLGITELLTLVPPEILKYLLLRPDLEENIDIDPTPMKLLRAYEEFQEAGAWTKKDVDMLDRADRKKAIAFLRATDKLHWNASFLDVLLYYQIYQDWEETGKLLKDPKGVQYLRPYVEAWIRKEFVPEDYRFRYQPQKAEGQVKKFVESLNEKMDALAIHNAVFEFAKENDIPPQELFKQLYTLLIGKERGPRLGKLVYALGVKKIKGNVL